MLNLNYLMDMFNLKKIVSYLTLSPIGVFYFLFLDLIDILFVYSKLIVILFLGKTEIELKLLEEMVAKQLKMTLMNSKGIIQGLLLVNVFGCDGDSLQAANVEASEVYLSIISGLYRAFQVLRLKLHSGTCNETFSDYCLECLMPRISWIPIETYVSAFLNGKSKDEKTNVTRRHGKQVKLIIIKIIITNNEAIV